MIYYLAQLLQKFDVPGMGMFQYISFRSGMAMIFSLAISLLIGKRIIRYLQKKQIGEEVRNLGLEGQMQKKGTPTMGGIIILLSIIIPVLLFTKLDNIYVIVMLVTTIWLGIVGVPGGTELGDAISHAYYVNPRALPPDLYDMTG